MVKPGLCLDTSHRDVVTLCSLCVANLQLRRCGVAAVVAGHRGFSAVPKRPQQTHLALKIVRRLGMVVFVGTGLSGAYMLSVGYSNRYPSDLVTAWQYWQPTCRRSERLRFGVVSWASEHEVGF